MGWAQVLKLIIAEIGVEGLKRLLREILGDTTPMPDAGVPEQPKCGCNRSVESDEWQDDPLVEEARWDRAVSSRRRPPRGCYWGF